MSCTPVLSSSVSHNFINLSIDPNRKTAHKVIMSTLDRYRMEFNAIEYIYIFHFTDNMIQHCGSNLILHV